MEAGREGKEGEGRGGESASPFHIPGSATAIAYKPLTYNVTKYKKYSILMKTLSFLKAVVR